MKSLGIKEQTIHKCGMCGTKEGEVRPIGQIVVQLTLSVCNGEQDYLCQTCFLLNNEAKRTKAFLEAKQQLKWFQKIRNFGFSS